MKLFKKHTPCYIVSVSGPQYNRSEEVANDAAARRYFEKNGVSFKRVSGHYQGRDKISFVVNADDIEHMLAIAMEYGQDNVLYIDEYRKAWLVTPDSWCGWTFLGQWQVRSGAGRENGDYTYDPQTRLTYVVR